MRRRGQDNNCSLDGVHKIIIMIVSSQFAGCQVHAKQLCAKVKQLECAYLQARNVVSRRGRLDFCVSTCRMQKKKDIFSCIYAPKILTCLFPHPKYCVTISCMLASARRVLGRCMAHLKQKEWIF